MPGPEGRALLWRRWVASQFRLSAAIDRRLVAAPDCHDAFAHFRQLVLSELRDGMTAYDIGGGRSPFLSPAARAEKKLCVVGLDVDTKELAAAPAGAYDRMIAADLTQYRGSGDADLVICHTVLEHVSDAQAALRGIASALCAGGRALIFVPCATSTFARLNRVVPEPLKRRLLDMVWPDDHDHNGFPARYDRCTPSRMAAAATAAGLEVEQVTAYFLSYYFYACAPLHAAWRLGANIRRRWRGDEAAEYFCLVARRAARAPRSAAPP